MLLTHYRNAAMPPLHHPPEELLATYALGSLHEAESLVLATHMVFCPACRKQVSRYEKIGGALLDEMPEVDLPESCFEATLALIKNTQSTPVPKMAKQRPSRIPFPLNEYIDP